MAAAAASASGSKALPREKLGSVAILRTAVHGTRPMKGLSSALFRVKIVYIDYDFDRSCFHFQATFRHICVDDQTGEMSPYVFIE